MSCLEWSVLLGTVSAQLYVKAKPATTLKKQERPGTPRYCTRLQIDIFHRNPKRKRVASLLPSLTLRVTVRVNRVQYKATVQRGSRRECRGQRGRAHRSEIVATTVTVRQLFVVESYQAQNGRVQIVHVDFVLDRVPAEFICGALDMASQRAYLVASSGIRSSPDVWVNK